MTQLLDGDYKSFGEDRLTQLAAASFNQSAAFRSCFLTFLGARNARKTKNTTARTQQSVSHNERLGRLDLVILRGNHVAVIVENKVESQLHPAQLKSYGKIPALKSVKKIALVKYYFEAQWTVAEWQVLHWRDFYLILRKRLDGTKRVPPVDGFVIRNFIEYLEAAHMHTPTKISKAHMNDLARMLHGLRYANETKFKWIFPKGPVFETAADWVRMMESVSDESRLIPKLTKVARKKYRFNSCISHWHDGESDKKSYAWIAVHWQIWFPKPRGKTKSVGLGLFVNDRGKWNIDAYRHVKGSDNIESKKIMDGRGDVVLANLSKKVLKVWLRWLQ